MAQKRKFRSLKPSLLSIALLSLSAAGFFWTQGETSERYRDILADSENRNGSEVTQLKARDFLYNNKGNLGLDKLSMLGMRNLASNYSK